MDGDGGGVGVGGEIRGAGSNERTDGFHGACDVHLL